MCIRDSYYITTPSDWAQYASGVNEVCPSCQNDKIEDSLKDCYSFISTKVKKK